MDFDDSLFEKLKEFENTLFEMERTLTFPVKSRKRMGKPTGRVSSRMQGSAEYDEHPQDVLTVKADFMTEWKENIYLRYKSYGNYNNNDWADANDLVYKGAAPDNAYFLTREAMKAYEYKTHNIKVILEPSVKEFLYPCFAYSNKENAEINDVKIDGEILPNHTYSLEIIPYERPYGCLYVDPKFMTIENNYHKYVRENYHEVPEHLSGLINKIIKEENLDRYIGIWEKIDCVCEYFDRNFVYSYDFYFPENRDMIESFLLSGKKYPDGKGRGICDHFSSAATLIFRALGLPARKTTGYVCHPNGSDTIKVTTNECHGWVEVYFLALGWVIVDPTPPINERTFKKRRTRDREQDLNRGKFWGNDIIFRD